MTMMMMMMMMMTIIIIIIILPLLPQYYRPFTFTLASFLGFST